MRSEFFQIYYRLGRTIALGLGISLVAGAAAAEPKHAIAMYGEPALPPDFVSLPYANPDAPTGGSMVTADVGSFDSLNPFVRKGRVPWQLRFLISESLMGRSLDEPFSLYGLLAETIETGPNREWVEFTLRPEARFSDGSPVTVEDVLWSFEALGTGGHGRYAGFWSKIETLEAVGERGVRFTFNEEGRELALLAGMRPILQKARYEGVDFAETDGFDYIPITSAPYVIDTFEAGRFISLKRNPDYWGNDVVPFRRGTNNLDEIRLEFFNDEIAAFEAFKVGEANFTREFSAGRWDSQYDFPRVQSGEVVLETFLHQRPTGMTGFVMNTRNPQFADWRVREAMLQAFNFEFINEAMTGSQQSRITSYYANSPLSMEPGPATGKVLEYLELFADDLLPGAIEGYDLPQGDGTERNRAGITAALASMEAAGWTVQDGVMKNADGVPFVFEIMLKTGAKESQAMIDMFVQSLTRLGITPIISAVDSAQYRERTDTYDFDMTYYRRGLSLSPGNEQSYYFGTEVADEAGGHNLMGLKSPAVDGIIEILVNSVSREDSLGAIKALDRALISGRYVIPTYSWAISRLAYSSNLRHPERIPIFGDWPGWQPDVWWSE